MKIKTLTVGAVFVVIISVLAIFGGVFGDYSDIRSERIGYVAEDGTLLDLDGNPIDEQDSFVEVDSIDGQLLGMEEYNSEFIEDDWYEEEDYCEERTRLAILREQEIMANPPRFDITAGGVHEIVDSLDLTNQFLIQFMPGGAKGDDWISTITIAMLSHDPLADELFLSEVELIAVTISERLGIDYPKEQMDEIMRTVFEGEVYVDGIQLEGIASFSFGTDGSGNRTLGRYDLSISKW
ncbi:MAG: hypothetical protein LBD23_18065 [Oscillospiraceae bacterium]|jgi:hypothetical protein|nr:hypothetical protein [Oscillospiraceae bacterium]